jgi:regulatory protein
VADTPDPCYLAAVRILKYRFNSEVELRRKLRAKQFDKASIDATIARLHEEKWLDDARFAGAFVRTRANRRIGGKRIVLELQAAGIDRSSAAKAVEENVDPEREREALLSLGAKRARALIRRHGAEFLSTAEGRNKLAGYLLKQGYDAALVADAVRELKIEN